MFLEGIKKQTGHLLQSSAATCLLYSNRTWYRPRRELCIKRLDWHVSSDQCRVHLPLCHWHKDSLYWNPKAQIAPLMLSVNLPKNKNAKHCRPTRCLPKSSPTA